VLRKALHLGRIRWLVIAPFLVVVALLVGLVVVSADILSAARAYVGGESLWSKGQKDAAYHLGRYVQSRHPTDYARVTAALAVPLGDRRAREALQRKPPDHAAAREGLLEGGNHADDVDGMIRLFLRFGRVNFMAEAIAIWTEADGRLAEFAAVAAQIHERIEAGDTAASPALQALTTRLPRLNEELTALERDFSATLGRASRTARDLVLLMSLLLASGLTAGGVALTAYMLRQQSQSEEQLQESNDRWALAAEAGGLGLFVWDLHGGNTTLDARAAELLGLAPQARVIRSTDLARETVHPDDQARVRAAMSQVIARPAPLHVRYRVQDPGGAARQIEAIASMRPPRRGDGAHLVGIVRDVSATVRAAELQLEKEAAERAARAKGEFLSRVSHELRTPLNAVLGFTELMRTDRSEPLTRTQEQRARLVQEAGRGLLALINDILDFGAVDSDTEPLSGEPVRLAPVLQASLQQIEPMAREQQVRLGADLPDAEVCVLADARRLGQVFNNLLSNAIKYNRPGGEVQIACAREGDAVVVSVRDTGPGMSPAQVAQLFQPFNRLGAEYSKVQGSGLGLVISRQLVKRMGGSLDVESAEGEGTCMTVRLRATAAAGLAESPSRESQAAPGA